MSLQRRNISSGSPMEPVIGLSRAVVVGNTVRVGGTAPIAPDGSTSAPGDIVGQARRCLEIIGKALHDAGASWADVVQTRILVTTLDRWREVAAAHGEIFGAIRPACTFAQVSAFVNPEWLIEIEAEAVIGCGARP